MRDKESGGTDYRNPIDYLALPETPIVEREICRTEGTGTHLWLPFLGHLHRRGGGGRPDLGEGWVEWTLSIRGPPCSHYSWVTVSYSTAMYRVVGYHYGTSGFNRVSIKKTYRRPSHLLSSSGPLVPG